MSGRSPGILCTPGDRPLVAAAQRQGVESHLSTCCRARDRDLTIDHERADLVGPLLVEGAVIEATVLWRRLLELVDEGLRLASRWV
jgi:hypothetical protein